MKYLIEIHHGLGDVIQITGLIETLYTKGDHPDIGVILFDESRADIFRNDKRVNNIYLLNIRDKNRINTLQTLLRIRKFKYDYAFFSSISNKRDTSILARIIGANKNYGEQFTNGRKYGKAYCGVTHLDDHIVKRNNNLLLTTGLFSEIADPQLFGLPHVDLENKDRKVIGLCIGTSKPSKTWPTDRYIKVAEFFEKKGYAIAFIGGKQEASVFPMKLFLEHDLWINCMGKYNIMESATVTSKCAVVLGGDTGVMHIAAAVGTPTVALFSCSDPSLHAPYSDNSYVITFPVNCQYCYESGGFTNCKDYKCVTGISVEEVIRVLNGILENKPLAQYRFKK